jgi:oligopeptide transport system substrate-binding protein
MQAYPAIAVFAVVSLLFSSCSEIAKPDPDSFFSRPVPPKVQEFRWSNGRAPRSIDPALAGAPPEADVVRAIFEGLTDLDPVTLEAVPAAAEKWTAADNFTTWTFYLRKGLVWSNSDPVIASDFVRSWARLASLGDKAAHYELLANISGMPQAIRSGTAEKKPVLPEFLNDANSNTAFPALGDPRRSEEANPSNLSRREHESTEKMEADTATSAVKSAPKFGVVAQSPLVLKVSLIAPDKDFPKLVANPIFRPVHGDGSDLSGSMIDVGAVTNGAFRMVQNGPDGLVLERAAYYWDRDSVKLDRVRFVPAESAEAALEQYRAGQVDAVSNAEFEPLVLKLLSPYQDFRQSVHNAVNLYEFNLAQPPFTDRRVRQALAVGIERERLTEGEMKGSTEPANHLLPFDSDTDARFPQDIEGARKLLEDAGFPAGNGFPVIRLVINRNDTQIRIARSVARMWKQNLNLETQIIIKEGAELDAARKAGEFDLIRRGLVFPSADTNANLSAIFSQERDLYGSLESKFLNEVPRTAERLETGKNEPVVRERQEPPAFQQSVLETTQRDAIFEFRVIPLYFPTTYSLIKPYVKGFDVNGLDAPSLRKVVIDSDWQPRNVKSES